MLRDVPVCGTASNPTPAAAAILGTASSPAPAAALLGTASSPAPAAAALIATASSPAPAAAAILGTASSPAPAAVHDGGQPRAAGEEAAGAGARLAATACVDDFFGSLSSEELGFKARRLGI